MSSSQLSERKPCCRRYATLRPGNSAPGLGPSGTTFSTGSPMTLCHPTPHLEVLPDAQRRVLLTLGWTRTKGLVLYGGTAVALRCGHRASVDFDFFTERQLSHEAILHELRKSGLAFRVLQDEKNALAAPGVILCRSRPHGEDYQAGTFSLPM